MPRIRELHFKNVFAGTILHIPTRARDGIIEILLQ